MLIRTLSAIVLLAALILPAQALPAGPATVNVEYVKPQQFTDVGDRLPGDRAMRLAYLEPLTRHLVRYAQPLLSAGQQLTVAVTDIDMAGEFEPLRLRTAGVRIVRAAYPPRIKLHFRLAGADGAVLREGDRRLRDAAFLMVAARYRDDPLRYEKRLLEQWLEQEFGKPAQPQPE